MRFTFLLIVTLVILAIYIDYSYADFWTDVGEALVSLKFDYLDVLLILD